MEIINTLSDWGDGCWLCSSRRANIYSTLCFASLLNFYLPLWNNEFAKDRFLLMLMPSSSLFVADNYFSHIYTLKFLALVLCRVK